MDERLRLPDADAERINIPANPKHYWRYRMHLNIEDLIADGKFIDDISYARRSAEDDKKRLEVKTSIIKNIYQNAEEIYIVVGVVAYDGYSPDCKVA